MKWSGQVTAGFALGVVGLASGAWMSLGDAAVEAANSLHREKRLLLQQVGREKAGGSLVAWLGDSTLLSKPGFPTYPQILRQRLGRSGSVEMRVIVAPGLDPYHYYYLTGPTLDLEPTVVVLIAHLRLFDPNVERRFSDFPELIPANELSRSLLLPFARRGLSVPEILLRRVLRMERVEAGLRRVEGLRSVIRRGVLEPMGARSVIASRVMEGAVRQRALRRYDTRVGPRHAMIRMLVASVRMAKQRGVSSLVVVSPVPYELLRDHGWYDRSTFATRVGFIQRAAEAEGAVVLDLHEALARDGFRDELGHYSPDGAARLADLVEPALVRLLADQAGGRARQGARDVY